MRTGRWTLATLLACTGLACACALHAGDPAKPAVKKLPIAKNVTLEIDGTVRRVLVNATVCLRQGQLEQLLTRKRTKEHESLLVADVDARDIHKALLLAGAEAGTPVKFQPKFAPPTGTTIKVQVEYADKGQTVRRPAQDWIRDIKTKKQLATDWVFAGSRLFQDPAQPDAPPYYLANDGDVVCVANFDTAMLDLPIDSTKDNDHLAFEAQTDRVPALETPVLIILEPVLAKKKP